MNHAEYIQTICTRTLSRAKVNSRLTEQLIQFTLWFKIISASMACPKIRTEMDLAQAPVTLHQDTYIWAYAGDESY